MKLMVDDAIQLLSLPVLSVRQPWASYLVSGLKSVELRSWSPQYKGWLWIHAGKRPDMVAMNLLNLRSEEFECGGLVGLAKVEDYEMIDCERKWLALRGDHLSPGWFQGRCYGWKFGDALSLAELIECPGELRLFRLAGSVRERVYQQISRSRHEDFIRSASSVMAVSLLP